MRPTTSRHRYRGFVLATLLAGVIGVLPPAAQVALAAGQLRLAADTTYTLDPDAGRVHVEIDVTATSLKPNSATFIYFYREIGFPLQADATSIRASDASGAITITTRKRTSFVEAVVRLRANLYYQRTTKFTIRYDLVGGAPRSESPIRVGAAFATFGVWAWGDPGRSYVEVRTPAGFEAEHVGGPLKTTTTPTAQFLFAEPADPDRFYAIITTENRSAYTVDRISFEGGVELVVQAWPEDEDWGETVETTLRAGVPELIELIGLDWPVTHDLRVRERYTPALEGYAGVFLTREQRIDVSEDLDPVVIMHEASHAWFNEDLFTERWIYEGLAQEYAWRTQVAVGGEDGGLAERPDLGDPGHVNLGRWFHPAVIRDQETDDRETYGYQASFWVIHLIVEAAGEKGMRTVFETADASVTAYPGAGPAEAVGAADDWQRLLDLVEPITEPDSDEIEDALRLYVLDLGDQALLNDRGDARDQYRDLLDAGNGWLAPYYVRNPLGLWQFDGAKERMAEAAAVLALRDQLETAADALDLDPDAALEEAYETTRTGFDGATDLANDQLEALVALESARVNVDAEPDLVSRVGLIGATPRVPYEAARAAFEAGELDAALAQAAAASTIITGAALVGQGRIIAGLLVAGLGLLLLVMLWVLLRRRARRRATFAATLLPAAAGALADGPVAGLETPMPGATLAANPAAAPAQAPTTSSVSPPDHEGG